MLSQNGTRFLNFFFPHDLEQHVLYLAQPLEVVSSLFPFLKIFHNTVPKIFNAA